MRYVFHALAPHDQLVYFDESTKALKPFEGELENEGRQVKVLFLDSEGKESIKNVAERICKESHVFPEAFEFEDRIGCTVKFIRAFECGSRSRKRRKRKRKEI